MLNADMTIHAFNYVVAIMFFPAQLLRADPAEANQREALAAHKRFMEWRGNPRDWEVRLKKEQTDYVLGEELPVEVSITNISQQNQLLVFSGPTTDFFLNLTDEAGHAVPFTDWYFKHNRSAHVTNFSERVFVSHETKRWTVDLAQCFILSAPGNYTLSVNRYLGSQPTFDAQLGIKAEPVIKGEPVRITIAAHRTRPKPVPTERISGPRLKVP